MDPSSRIFLIPQGHEEFEIIHITIGSTEKSLALSNGDIYELKEIGCTSFFDPKSEPKCSSGQPVKSLILESANKDFECVMSNPTMVAFSAFDLVLPLIEWMSATEVYSSRFHSTEDILDGFVSTFSTADVSKSIELNVREALPMICDSIAENNEDFFKFNFDKACSILTKKIQKMSKFLLENRQTRLFKKIASSVSLSGEEAPENVIEQQTSRYCIDYVMRSYLSERMKDAYLQNVSVDFSLLSAFMESQRKSIIARNVADTNMVDISGASGSRRTEPRKDLPKKSQGKKKSTKVAVGKGALDSFFKSK